MLMQLGCICQFAKKIFRRARAGHWHSLRLRDSAERRKQNFLFLLEEKLEAIWWAVLRAAHNSGSSISLFTKLEA